MEPIGEANWREKPVISDFRLLKERERERERNPSLPKWFRIPKDGSLSRLHSSVPPLVLHLVSKTPQFMVSFSLQKKRKPEKKRIHKFSRENLA